ncbi:MAG: hypothetical protein IPF57_23520 [Gammaproteobacteria bacterium]|nr:hypothetical protein [Gammaproteobacteria bacterium]
MSSHPRLLLISHDLGGGVERHVRDLQALLGPSADVDLLHPHDASTLVLEAAGAGPAWWRFHDWDDVSPRLPRAVMTGSGSTTCTALRPSSWSCPRAWDCPTT